MALTHDAAARKDANTRAPMQHRHFATIAAIIRDMPSTGIARGDIARVFAGELAGTNPKFDRERFLRACGVTV